MGFIYFFFSAWIAGGPVSLGHQQLFQPANRFIQAQKELDENAQHKIPKGNKDENDKIAVAGRPEGSDQNCNRSFSSAWTKDILLNMPGRQNRLRRRK